MKKLLLAFLALLGASAAYATGGYLTSSTMAVQYDAQGHEMFVYTCVYSDGVVLQNMPHCPADD